MSGDRIDLLPSDAGFTDFHGLTRALDDCTADIKRCIDEARMEDAIRDALLNYDTQRFCYVNAFSFYHPPKSEPTWDERAEALAVRGTRFGY